MDFDKLSAVISDALTQKTPLLVAIDGRCGAGKTTVAARLAEKFGCNVIHTDDFFLAVKKRTPERLLTPGGNIDVERLSCEVMTPLLSGLPFSYRPYDCHTDNLKPPVEITPTRLTVIEGSYSCHPMLWDSYGLRVFIDVDPKTQLERIRARNGEDAAKVFESRWIPLEEKYFAAYSVKEKCDVVVEAENE